MKQQLQIAAPEAHFGKRHVQTLLVALSSFTIYCLRINLSVAIVAMVGMGNDKHDSTDLNSTATATAEPANHPVYDWDEKTQGMVLTSFFCGYLVTQIPAGVLTQKYGGHSFLKWSLVVTSAFTILLPPCAYLGDWWLVSINRILQGLSQGFIYPSIYSMMGLWFPALERARLAGIGLGAQLIGPIIATPIAGYMAAFFGWPSIFYGFGGMGFVAAAIVWKFGADSPSVHPTISPEERAYIESSVGATKEKFTVPFKSLLTSTPAWAAILTMALHGGIFLIFLTKIPTYLSTVLKFNIKDNGLLSALPYLASWIMSFVFSWFYDYVLVKRFTMTQCRKINNSFAHFGPAVVMVVLGYSSDAAVCVALLTIATGFMSGAYSGVQSNFMDLAPNFSGTIFSVSNCLSGLAGVISAMTVSYIVTESGSLIQWRIVYFLCAAVMFFSGVLFIVFGSAEVQEWNFPEHERQKFRESKCDDHPEKGDKLSAD